MKDAEAGFSSHDLKMHWLIVTVMALSVTGYILICRYVGLKMQIAVDEPQRVLIRTILYAVGIVIFPVTSLLRHIMLRLNQTMPGDTPARSRYLVTVIITQAMIETVALFGLVMFVLGDDYNTLYIFSAMAFLGIFLHRPRMDEYLQIVSALLHPSPPRRNG